MSSCEFTLRIWDGFYIYISVRFELTLTRFTIRSNTEFTSTCRFDLISHLRDLQSGQKRNLHPRVGSTWSHINTIIHINFQLILIRINLSNDPTDAVTSVVGKLNGSWSQPINQFFFAVKCLPKKSQATGTDRCVYVWCAYSPKPYDFFPISLLKPGQIMDMLLFFRFLPWIEWKCK